MNLKKTQAGICLAIILWAVLAANSWRFYPPDPDCVRAAALYTEILQDAVIVGIEYSGLTTTLGSYAVKKVSEDPAAAALMVRLLKDAGVSRASVAAINASGSFPGFVLAALSACTALGIKTCVIASVGASTYGANTPGNTIADMLLKNSVRKLDYTLLAVTPGGSDDRGLELDTEELDRVSAMLEKQGIAFIQSPDLVNAIAMREFLFNQAGCSLLINIGGSHASGGADADLALMAGILKPDKEKAYKEPGLIQNFLASGRPVIQILNVRRLYAAYGLEFDKNGKLSGSAGKLFRRKQLPPLAVILPVPLMLVLLAVVRYSRIDKRHR